MWPSSLPRRMLARHLRVGNSQASRIQASASASASRRHVSSPAAAGPSPAPDSPVATDPAASADLSTSHEPSRQQRVKDARPFSDFLTDTYGRQHDYLRISVTERCNLRCVYCMPEEGVPLSPSRSVLTTPEIVLLSSLFVSQGVTKIRLTGGEPTVRKDIVELMRQIGGLRRHGLRELCLTTNGISLHRKLEAMVEAGLTGVNLSLDTLDPWQFQIMTRRAGFDAVRRSIDRVFELNRAGAGIRFKINCVVMRGVNDREILPFVEMTRDRDVEVRFIEYMPFDGNRWSEGKMLGYREMLETIRSEHPTVRKVLDRASDTSKTYQVPGFAGRIGFITSMTHNFCGTCNRLRITADGNLKVCLFGNAEVSLRDMVRKINSGEPIEAEALEAMRRAAVDGSSHLAPAPDRQPLLAPNSQELLDVIRTAVKNKKEKHAGIGELEHMKNRPMILIDPVHTPTQHRMPAQTWSTGLARPWSATPQRVRALLSSTPHPTSQHPRPFTTSGRLQGDDEPEAKLTHVSETGSAHMVSIGSKAVTARVATAKCRVRFSDATAARLIRENQVAKGDVLGVARVAGIMAAKRTAELIPLCHPVALSRVDVEIGVVSDREVEIAATAACEGKTGVEMEALTAAAAAALTVYDMCKAVDKGMVIEGLRVVLKEGGKSGRWVEGARD